MIKLFVICALLIAGCVASNVSKPQSPMLCMAAQERMRALGCKYLICEKINAKCVSNAESQNDVAKCETKCK